MQCESKGRDSDIFIPHRSQVYLTSDREGKERLDRGQFRERNSWADTLRVVKEGRGGAEYHRHQEKETQERSCYEGNNGSKEGEIQRLANTNR